jgi:hypothetical protein
LLNVNTISAVRIARNSLGGYGPIPTQSDVRTRYLALNPHVALSPVPSTDALESEQKSNEGAWALLLANRILPLLLPSADLSNPCLDVLITEIFADMIIRDGVCGKASEPWLIWEGVTRAVSPARRQVPHGQPTPSVPALQGSANENQSVSQFSEIKARWDLVVLTFWSVVQTFTTLIQILRSLTATITQAATLPARSHYAPSTKEQLPIKNQTRALPRGTNGELLTESSTELDDQYKRPIISMSMWTCGSRLLALEQRMPWLTGLLSLLHWFAILGPGRVCEFDSRLDR